MAGQPQYAWPSVKVLVALVHKYGVGEAASRVGVPRTTLKSHLESEGVPPEDRRKALKSLDEKALEEVARLVK